MTSKYKQFMARMRWATYLKLRASFKALPKESASSYFKRLSVALEAGWDKILKIDPHGNVGVGK